MNIQNKIVEKNKILDLVTKFTESFYNKRKFVPGETLIPPSGKLIGHEEICNIVESALDGWLTAGKFNIAFEKNYQNILVLNMY